MGSVMPILTAQEQNAVAHWASGLDLAVLAEVFDEAITIAIMQRQLDSAMRASIAAQCAAQPWQLAWRGPADATLEQALIRSMPAPQQATELIADVRLLAKAVACLFDVEAVGIRMRLLDGAMCPRFHCDNLPARLVTTYSGPGSEWLPEQALERAGLGKPEPGKPEVVLDASAIRQLAEGDVCLLKEALINSTRPLRVFKRVAARRDVKPIVVLLASSVTQQMHA